MWPVAFALGAGTAVVFKKMLSKASEGAAEDIAGIREKFRSENISELASSRIVTPSIWLCLVLGSSLRQSAMAGYDESPQCPMK